MSSDQTRPGVELENFDLHECAFKIITVYDIVVNTQISIVGNTVLKFSHGFTAIRMSYLQNAIEKRYNDIVVFMDMPPGIVTFF